MRNLILLSFLVFAFTSELSSQNFYRITGEFSIKGKAENSSQLILGKFYYDKNVGKIVTENNFPENETWITSDTNLYKIVNKAIVSRQTIPNLNSFSIYHLVLNNKLKNFGLEGSIYALEGVEKDKGLVISTWVPGEKFKKMYGKVLLSTQNNNLTGILFYSPEGVLIKKQFFEEYAIYNGLAFPGKVIEIVIKNGKEYYQVTTYKNIKVNDVSEDYKYYFNTADYKLQSK